VREAQRGNRGTLLERFIHRGSAPIGVDIGTGGVRLLQLRRTGRAIEVAAAARIDRRTEDPSEAPISPRMVETIRRRLETGDFVGRECFMTFPDHWLNARSVRLPVMPEEETDAALALEASDRLGFSEEHPGEVSWVHAGRVRQGDEIREEIILLGADRDPLTVLVDAVSESGLRPQAVEPSFLSTARTYSQRHRREDDQTIVRVGLDLGRKNTGVIVLRGSSVAFYKPLRISGEDLTKAVSERLEIPIDAAADLRRQRIEATAKNDGEFDESVSRTVFDAVRPLLDELAKETALCLRYFTVAFTGDRPTEVFTTGDEASEPMLAEILGETLRLNHRVGDPFFNMNILPGVRLGGGCRRSEWSAAVGLSLRGLPNARRQRGADAAPIIEGPTRTEAA